MIHYRALLLEKPNDTDRTVEASLSSETPVFRPGLGREILSHAPGAIDLSRAPIPVLTSHKRDETPVGVVENLRVVGGKLRGTLRLGNSQRAKEVWEDIKAGVLRSISVGYSIIKGAAKGDDYLVSLWQLLEVSLVAVPADPTVGIGRSYPEGIITMDHNQDNTSELEHLSRSQRRAAGRSEEETRNAAAQIYAFAHEFKIPHHKVSAFIEERGLNVDAFRHFVLDQCRETGAIRPHESSDIGMSSREASQFSFVKAIRASVDPAWGQRNAGLEREASRAFEQKVGKAPQGIWIPPEVLQRDLTVGTASAGGNLVATEHLADKFIDILRNRSHVVTLGATELRDLNGDVAIPTQTGASTGFWVEENTAPGASNMTFGQLTMRPKTLGAYVDFSRKLVLQASPSIESLVRADLASVLAIELDRAAINGSGSGAEPIGILNTSGIGSVAIGANGGAPTWEHMLMLEEALAAANADVGSLGILTTSAVRKKLKGTSKVSGDVGAGFVWEAAPADPDGFGRVNGYRAAASGNVPANLTKGTSSGVCSAIIFGNWADLVIGRWGGLDLLTDPYAMSTSGGVRVIALLDCDFGIRHAASFAAIKDALTA